MVKKKTKKTQKTVVYYMGNGIAGLKACAHSLGLKEVPHKTIMSTKDVKFIEVIK